MSKEGKRTKDLREKLLQALDEFRTWMHEHGESVQAALNSLSTTNSENFQNLCNYVDFVEDKANGIARALYAYTDLMASEHEDLENRVAALEAASLGDDPGPRDGGWMPRLTENILIGAANNAREQRLQAYAERHRDELEEERQEDQEDQEKPLHQMTDQELIAATEAQVEEELETQYPAGTQLFGD